jgi:hypothetical protein
MTLYERIDKSIRDYYSPIERHEYGWCNCHLSIVKKEDNIFQLFIWNYNGNELGINFQLKK